MSQHAHKSREVLEHELVAALQTIETQKAAAKKGRRRTDHPSEDHMHEREDDGEIALGYKGAQLGIRGPLAIVAVLVAVVGFALVYVNYQGFEDTKALLRQNIADHAMAREQQDLLGCIVSLSPEERTRVRMQGSREGFTVVCPWLRGAPAR